MGREIKFRFWDAKQNKMFDEVTLIGLHWKRDNDPPVYVGGDEFDYGNDRTVPYYSDGALMQYTGLKDKNGKEIYEGDICIGGALWATGGFQIKNDCATTVTFQDGMFKLGKISLISFASRCEVIGNIYENKELIQHGETT